jgi:hypothetical protein
LIQNFLTTERERTRGTALLLCSGSPFTYSRLAGYDETNDAERLCVDPEMRHIAGGRAIERSASQKQSGLHTVISGGFEK